MAILSLQKSGATFTVNTLPFIKRVLQIVGPHADFHEVHEQIQSGEIEMEPGDYLSTVNLGSISRGAKIGISDLEAVLQAYVGTTDAHLSFNELRLRQLAYAGQELDAIRGFETIEITSPGESFYFTPSDPKLVFATGEKHILDKQVDKNFSIYGYEPDSDGGGRLIVTHVRGFDDVVDLQIPAHYLNEEDNPTLAVLDVKVQLPPNPGKKIKKFHCVVSEEKPGIVNIGKEGLCVPYGDSTFVEMLVYPFGLVNSYRISPRLIDGLFINPDATKHGSELVISTARPIKKKEDKKIFTHVQKTDGSIAPISLHIRLMP